MTKWAKLEHVSRVTKTSSPSEVYRLLEPGPVVLLTTVRKGQANVMGGNGPAVGSLKIAPADLTLLAKRNGGTFPAEQVRKLVGDWVDISAHGSREMPIWGDLFHPKSAADQQIANERFRNLIAYMESIQQ